MADLYLNPDVTGPGTGAVDDPYKAPPSDTLTASNDWYLRAGTTLDMGATSLDIGSGVSVRRYGEGSDPRIVSAATVAVNCDGKTAAVLFEDICIERTGAVGGVGLQARFLQNANASLTVRRCLIGGFTTDFLGTRSSRVTIEDSMFLGASTTFGISAIAQNAQNCDTWRIRRNTMCDIGIGIYLLVSDTAITAGRFSDLQITGNVIDGTASSAIIMSTLASHATSGHSVSVTAPSTITKDIAWPAWTAGQKVFLAGFSNLANFGEVTVASVSGTTLTVEEASLTTEGPGTNKGAHLRDPDRAFVNVLISRNICTRQGETVMAISIATDVVVSDNVVTDALGTTAMSAGIQFINVLRGHVLNNEVRRINATVQLIDIAGIFIDGAAEDCTIIGNRVSDCPGAVTGTSAGAGLGYYMAINCHFEANIVERCLTGFGTGGVPTAGTIIGNVFAYNTYAGWRSNGSPQPGAHVVKNNLIIGNFIGLKDDTADAEISNNAWWQNTTENFFGPIADRDAEAITDDPMVTADYRPLPGSPLIGAGLHLGYKRDINGVQRFNPPTVGAVEPVRTRATASEREARNG